MRAVELIGCHVVDSDGRRIGTVHDLRLVAGPQTHGLSGYRLDALVTGSASIGSRVGYAGGRTSGPWPLPQLFARLSREVHVVPWREVGEIDEKLIRLRVPASRLVPGRTGRPGRPGRLGGPGGRSGR